MRFAVDEGRDQGFMGVGFLPREARQLLESQLQGLGATHGLLPVLSSDVRLVLEGLLLEEGAAQQPVWKSSRRPPRRRRGRQSVYPSRE